MPDSPRRKRAWTSALVAGLVGWTVLAAGMDNGHFGIFQDDGLYLCSARSLRDGKGFGLPSRPGEPPPKYPIGLPAAVALALRLDPGPPTLAREVAIARGLVMVGGWAFFLGAYTWLGRLRVPPWAASAIVLGTAWHYVVMIGGANTLFADLPFAGVSFLLITRWAGRARDIGRDETARRAPRRAFVDGAIAGAAFLLRSNGITLAAAALVAAALGPRRRSSLLACATALGLVIVPATSYAGRHPRVVPSNSYLLELRAAWTSGPAGMAILARNAASMAFDYPARVLFSPATNLGPVLRAIAAFPTAALACRVALGLIVAAGLVGLARSSRRGDVPTWVHAGGTMAIFAAWPWSGIMERFLLCLMPMVGLAFARGLGSLGRLARLGPIGRRRLVAAGLAFVVAGNAAVVLRAASIFHRTGGQWPGAPDRASLGLALGLVRDRTEPDAVIAAAWPEMVHLHTGRTVVPLVEDDAVMTGRHGDVARLELWRSLVPGRPFYVLHRSDSEDDRGADATQLRALAAASGASIRTVARTPDGRYRVSRVVEGDAGTVARAARPRR